ncbi:MAG TPA: glycosyltransferase family 87 protein [Candidatus Dormibacteraeota bacterium]|nr:glycosyltransferase family 87 protein [Candidatus Dormibacteraeota bacterium]
MTTRPSAARVSPAPALPRIRPAFIAQGAVVGASLVIYALVLAQAGLRHQDFTAYLTAGHDLLSGRSLYTTFLHHPFPDPTLRPAYIYPPIFAVLMAPLSLLPAALATTLWVLLSQASLAVSLLLFIRRFHPTAWATAALLAATATFYPLWVDAVQGQANLIVLVLVTAGMVGVLSATPRAAVALGLAAGLKLTPAILIVWLLVERRFREAAWMVAGFVAITGLGAVARWRDSWVFFTQVAPALARGTAVYANQSLFGVLGRLTTANPYTNPWVVLPVTVLLPAIAALLLGGLWFWRTRHQDAAPRAFAFLPLLPLLSSVTWPHHLVIVLPAIWLALVAVASLDWPLPRTLALAALLAGFSVIARLPAGPGFDQPGFKAAQTGDPIVLLTANALFGCTLLLFLLAPWLLRSR